MSKPEPEPLDIDADPRNADWLKTLKGNTMSTPANPGSGVGNVHKPGPLQKKPVKKQPSSKKK